MNTISIIVFATIILLFMGAFLFWGIWEYNKRMDDRQTGIIQPTHKKISPVTILAIAVYMVIVGVVITMAFGSLISVTIPVTGAKSSPTPPVTMERYNKAQVGMNYQQVVNIMGQEGEQQGMSFDIIGLKTTIVYNWVNPDGSNMNAVFQNNLLVSKSQSGLKY
jgi:hypothetical protein